MDSGGSFGTTQIVTSQPYLPNVGHNSPPIAFTDGGTEYVALAILINDDSGSTSQSQRIFYATVSSGTGTLTWSDNTISQAVYGDNTPDLLYERDLVFEPQSITLQYLAGILYCVWMWSENDSFLGYFYESHANFGSFSWSTPAILISVADDPTYNYYMPEDLSSWSGVTQMWFAGCSVGDSSGIFGSDVMQVFHQTIIATTKPRPRVASNPFIHGKFLRFRHR
jgi:hypothetical protein